MMKNVFPMILLAFWISLSFGAPTAENSKSLFKPSSVDVNEIPVENVNKSQQPEPKNKQQGLPILINGPTAAEEQSAVIKNRPAREAGTVSLVAKPIVVSQQTRRVDPAGSNQNVLPSQNPKKYGSAAAIPSSPDDSTSADDRAPPVETNNNPAETKSNKHQSRVPNSNRSKRQEGSGQPDGHQQQQQQQQQQEVNLPQVNVNNGNGPPPPVLPGIGAPNPFGPPRVPFEPFRGPVPQGGPFVPAQLGVEPFPAPGAAGQAPSFVPQQGQAEGGEGQRQ